MGRGPVFLDSKDISEIDVLTFDYEKELVQVSELISTAAVTSEFFGTTTTPYPDILYGPPQVYKNLVLQQIRGGLANNSYHIRCVITTTAGRELTLSCVLPVSRI